MPGAVRVVRKVLARLVPHRALFALAVLEVTAIGLLELAKPWPLKLVVDSVLGGKRHSRCNPTRHQVHHLVARHVGGKRGHLHSLGLQVAVLGPSGGQYGLHRFGFSVGQHQRREEIDAFEKA